MEGGALTGLMLTIKIGLGVSALSAIGLSLHVAIGIVPKSQAASVRMLAAAAAFFAVLFAGGRVLLTSAELGGGLDLALDPQSLAWAWSSHQNNLAAVGAGFSVIIATLWLRQSALSMVGALCIATSFAFLGHTQALDAPGVAPWTLALHVLIAGYWVAAPLTLWPAHSIGETELARRLDRFGAFALLLIPALFVVGGWLAWRLAGSFDTMLSTLYGQLLLAKLSLALLALGLGAFNKQIVGKLVKSNPARGRRWLKTTLAVDGLLFSGALLLVVLATTVTGPMG